MFRVVGDVRTPPIIRICMLACAWIALTSGARADELIYAFSGSETGGIAALTVNRATGALESQRVLLEGAPWKAIRKIAIWTGKDGRSAIGATSPATGAGNVVVLELPSAPAVPAPGDPASARAPSIPPRITSLELPAAADEIRATKHGFLVGGDDGWMMNVILDEEIAGRICEGRPPCTQLWNARARLAPTGSKSEDIRVRADGASAWVTLQKDSKKDGHRGHRLIRLALPGLELLGDLSIERSMPEHHPPKSPREHGPAPEIVVEDPSTNTLVVTLDNYGAVLLADLDSALRGTWSNAQRISCAADGAFGTAFPDRIVIIDRPEGALALVANSGPEGGMALLDLSKRALAATARSRPGLESLSVLANGTMIAAASAGKIKVRGDDGAEKRYEPWPEIAIFSITPGPALEATIIPQERPVTWLQAIAPDDPAGPLLAIAERGSGAEKDRFVILRVTRPSVNERGETVGPAAHRLGTIDALGRIERTALTRSRAP